MLDTRWTGFLVAGIDVDAPAGVDGRSLMDRFEAGAFGEGVYDPDEPHASFLREFDALRGFPRPSRLRPFVAARPESPREPWRVVVGVEAARAELAGTDLVSVDVAAAREALAEAARLLAAVGVGVPPGYFGIFEPGEDR